MTGFKKFLKRAGIFLGIFVVILLIIYLIIDKPLPQGQAGPEAEKLADKMLEAVNIQAWDSLHYLTWISPRSNKRYVWDRQQDWAYSNDSGFVAKIDLKHGIGVIWDDHGNQLTGKGGERELAKAIHHFWNDSFWLIAFTKVRDEGTTRKLVELENGEKALLVTYTQGGNTPGDSYLWHLDENGRPKAWQIWVKILPIGGLNFTWEKWDTLPGGALYASEHKASLFTVKQEGVNGAQTLEELGFQKDLFDDLILLQRK